MKLPAPSYSQARGLARRWAAQAEAAEGLERLLTVGGDS